MKNILIIVSLMALVIFFSFPLRLSAQGPGFTDDTTDAPIDGGISLLVAAGVGYGVRKVTAKRKAKNRVNEEQKK